LPQVRFGGVVSTTVTTWLHRLAFRHESYASPVRDALNVFPQNPTRFCVVPTIRKVTLVPSQSSKAGGMAKAHVVPHSTVWSLPQVSSGGVVSMTVTVCVQVALLLHESV